MTIDQNTLRRLNKLWKDRHGHDEDTTAAELVEIRETISVGTGGAIVSPAYIHLTHNAGQTIAVAGEAISWDTQHPLIDPVGFADPADATTTNLPITTVVVPYDGYYGVKVELKWDSHTAGGTVEIRRTRNSNAVRLWPTDDDPGIWTATNGQTFADIAVVPVVAGDELSVYVDHDAGATKDLATAQVIFYKVESSAVIRSLYKAAILASGPLAYWRLDDTGATAADSAGHADGPFTLTYVGSPTQSATGVMQDGSGSTSVEFNGSTQGADGSDWSNFDFGSGNFSMEAWFNADADNAIILQKAEFASPFEGFNFVLSASTEVEFVAGTTSAEWGRVTSAALTTDSDHYAAVTFDGTTLRLYVDGVFVVDDTPSGTIGDTANKVSLGYDEAGSASYWNGHLDEVAVYDRALDPDEILEHYNIGRGVFL